MLLLGACLINTELYDERKDDLTDHDGDGFVLEGDCDDGDAGVFPGATETCDGRDEDCDGLIDENAVDATAWFKDVDQDGHGGLSGEEVACEAPSGFVDQDDDCDDQDSAVAPGLTDQWYDGIDSNCDGADDNDADGDGDPWDQAGGSDCDDDDPLIAGTAEESWTDAGIDNDCDGSIEDQAMAEFDDLGGRIDGSSEGASFGITIAALPPGWASDEAVLLVAAPFTASGDVYGWPASALEGSPPLESASWHLTGSNVADFLGYGMGWAGSDLNALIVIGSEGAMDARGQVAVWSGSSLPGAPKFTILGESAGGFLGAQVVSGHDQDGDGIADVIVTAPLDSRVAPNAGAVFVFLDAVRLSGEVAVAESDIQFTTNYAGARLAVSSVGDANGDGTDDLGFTQDIPYPTGPGGLLVTDVRTEGQYDLATASSAQFHGGPFVFGKAWDPDGDGTKAILAASGGIHSFLLPLAGTVTPWDDAERSIKFADTETSTRWLRTDVGDYAGHGAFVAASTNFDGARGMVAIQRPYWTEDQRVDDAAFLALGEAAGDQVATGLDFLDWDSDDILDLAVGAPGVDAGGRGSGSVYLVPGPR